MWQEVDEGILPTLYGAVSPDAKGGAFYGPRGFFELAGGGVTDAKILARASNEADGRRLWEISEQLTGDLSGVRRLPSCVDRSCRLPARLGGRDA